MPADLHLHLRAAGRWDIPATVDALTPALADTSLARWLNPSVRTRVSRLRPRLQHLLTQHVAAGTVRIAEDDGHILGAAVWTTCPPATADANSPDTALLDGHDDGHQARLLDAHL